MIPFPLVIVTLFILPHTVSAQGLFARGRSLKEIVEMLIDFIRIGILPVLLSIFFIFFFWQVFQFIRSLESGGGQNTYESFLNHVLLPLILIFVVVSVWGLVTLLQNIFFTIQVAQVNNIFFVSYIV